MAEQNYIARMRAKVGHEGMIFNTVFENFSHCRGIILPLISYGNSA